MSIFSRLSESMTNSKPRAVAFVDFENWYISLDRLYHRRPDMQAWMTELQKTYNIREIYVFGDFSNQSLRAEIPKIREITNIIIETQNASNYVTKDFTDFIMLDHIYQKALSAHDIKAFIIFSCDGHFSSSVSFLKNQCGKTVEVYGVKGAMSNQLRNTATKCTEIPNEESAELLDQKYYDQIFANLKYLSDNNRGSHRMYPSFKGTVDAVAGYYSSDEEDVTRALRYLIDRDYIYQTEEKVGGHTLKVLNVNWELAHREGVYDPDGKDSGSEPAPQNNRQHTAAPERSGSQPKSGERSDESGNRNSQTRPSQNRQSQNRTEAQDKRSAAAGQTVQKQTASAEKADDSPEKVRNIKPHPPVKSEGQSKRDDSQPKRAKNNRPPEADNDEIDVAGIIGRIDGGEASQSGQAKPETTAENESSHNSSGQGSEAKKKRSRRRYYHRPQNNAPSEAPKQEN